MRDFADSERAKRIIKHVKDNHRYGLFYIALERAECKRSLNTKSITSASMGIRIRRGGNAGTAPWSDRGIGQLLWHYAYQELNYTVYGKAEERKSVTSISAGLL